MDGREKRAHRNNWNKPRERRRQQGKANLNPRRRRKFQEWLREGYKNPDVRLFAERSEWHEDITLTMRVLRMSNYEIPPDVFKLIIDTGQRICKDKDAEIAIRGAELLRKVVRDRHEIEILELEKEAIRNGSQTQKVEVTLDPKFFDNDAHERAKEGENAKTDGEG